MTEKGKLYNIFFIGFLVALALPILNLPPTFSPPDWGKTLVFRIILSAGLFVFALFLFYKPTFIRSIQWKKKESIGFWLLSGLFLTFLLATIFSLDSNFSLWGSPVRSGGFITFASYIIFTFLAFLTLQDKDWKKAWVFSIVIGILISIVALIQWQGILPGTFVEAERRPISTLGNPIILAIYLLFLSFMSFSFGLKEKVHWKKYSYLAAFILFIFIILITESRAAYLGLAIGLSYFILFFTFNKLSRSLIIKGSFIFLIAAMAGFVYFVNVNAGPKLPEFIQENRVLRTASQRLYIGLFLEDPRFSTWKVGWEGLKQRPLLGYGPDNFAIAFDKNYKADLPGIQHIAGTPNSWWDRAHNLFLDVGIQAGIPAALIYFALFGTLIWQLQKVKKIKPEKILILHGVQASLIAYIVANFFAFDTFSTYLLFFFLVAYSLFLIHTSTKNNKEEQEKKSEQESSPRILRYKKITLLALAFFLLWFSWQYALHPLLIQRQLNMGKALINIQRCEGGLNRIQGAKEMGNTFLDGYLQVKYFDALRACEQQCYLSLLESARVGYTLMKEAVEFWPNHTRNWIFLGQLNNVVTEQETKAGSLSQEQINEKLAESHSYFKKANELSPEHQEVYIEWIKTFTLEKDYRGAVAKAQECIDLNPNTGECWWLKGLAEEVLKEAEQSRLDIKMAIEKRFKPDTLVALGQLAETYVASLNFGKLAETYEKLIELRPNEVQLHTSLAFTYYQNGQIAKARKKTLEIMKLFPETKEEAEIFLKILDN